MNETKLCTACRESIHAEATRCPHCRSRQGDPGPLHRGHPDRVLAGVCAAIAAQLGVQALWVRLGVVLAALVTGGLVLWLYGLLWVATPAGPGATPPLSRFVAWLKDLFSGAPRPSEPGAPSV